MLNLEKLVVTDNQWNVLCDYSIESDKFIVANNVEVIDWTDVGTLWIVLKEYTSSIDSVKTDWKVYFTKD